MSKTLVVTYFYKNKFFSNKKSEGQGSKSYLINKRIVIGSDPKLFWQIFNSDFPRKFILLNKEKDQYYINLLKTFSIEIKKGSKELTAEDLKSQGILKSNKLKLNQDLSGKIIINSDTLITFEYKNFEDVHDAEDKANLVIFNKKHELSPELRHKRYAAIGVIMFVSILYLLFGYNYEPPKELTQFEQAMTDIQTSIDFLAERDINQDSKTARDLATTNPGNQPIDKPSEVLPTVDLAVQKAKEERQMQLRNLNLPTNGTPTGPNLDFTANTNPRADSPSGGPGGGGGALVLKSALTGVKNSSRKFGMQGVQNSILNTKLLASQYSESNRGTGDALTSSASNINVSDIKDGDNIAGFNSEGGVNTSKIQLSLQDRSAGIDSLKPSTGNIDDLKVTGPKIIDKTPTVNSNSDKKRIFDAWFEDSARPDINEITRDMQRKTGLTGQIDLTLRFKNSVLIRVDGNFTGSSDGRSLIQKIKRELTKRQCPGIGDYEGKKHITIR